MLKKSMLIAALMVTPAMADEIKVVSSQRIIHECGFHEIEVIPPYSEVSVTLIKPDGTDQLWAYEDPWEVSLNIPCRPDYIYRVKILSGDKAKIIWLFYRGEG